jgi:hypothetical protein
MVEGAQRIFFLKEPKKMGGERSARALSVPKTHYFSEKVYGKHRIFFQL